MTGSDPKRAFGIIGRRGKYVIFTPIQYREDGFYRKNRVLQQITEFTRWIAQVYSPDSMPTETTTSSHHKLTGKSASNPAVCILGMHRSGTSCLAGSLEEHGLHLGEVVNFSQHNRKGSKENLQLRQINDEILAVSGGAWDRPPEQLIWNDALRRNRDDLIESYHLHKNWGFKDPRTILTLPFWFEAIPNMRLVGTFRHPLNVVLSLMLRQDTIPDAPPLDLWKHYNLELLKIVNRHRFPLVCFDWPADEYVDAVGKISRYLDLRENPDASQRFFEENLRSSYRAEETEISIGAAELAIYEELMDSALNFSGVSVGNGDDGIK